MHIKQGQYNLLFSNASLSDSGIYECFEEDKDDGPLKKYNVTVVDGNCFPAIVLFVIGPIYTASDVPVEE